MQSLTDNNPQRRLPAEWEEQEGVLIAWPHEGSDWSPCLPLVEPVFARIVVEISRHEQVLIVAPEPVDVAGRLRAAGAEMGRVSIHRIATNDTWARDFGPISVLEDGRPLLLDYGFNGWGLKFAADLDNRVTRRLHDAGAFGSTPLRTMGMVLEGGSIESDGRGTILTTAQCLLDPNRNPHLSREEIGALLKEQLGCDHLLWLNHGFLEGDDTDSHVDTLARLCPDDTIAYMSCDDGEDRHFAPLAAMAAELASFRTREGRPFRLVPLPWPAPVHDRDGARLPATYANFLVMNRAVLVPLYGDRNDRAALETIGGLFPGREAVGIDCRPLILQHGSLHCVTMQLPKGVLA